jgi:hypothetical protein
MNTISIKEQQTTPKIAMILLLSLLVTHASTINTRVHREVPLGFRYVAHVGTVSGERIWCVFTKDKNSFRFYHPQNEARAVFSRSPIPKFQLHDTQDP